MSKSVRAAKDAPIFITMGEPSGIGPEVALGAFAALDGQIGSHPLILVGDAQIFASRRAALIATKARVNASPGKLDPANAAAVIEAIEIAVKACLSGEAAAMVTAPIHKAGLAVAGFTFPGHTEFLAHLTQSPRAVMMLASEKLRVVPLTVHMAVARVPAAISTQAIIETAEIVLAALARDFGIVNPRLAVAGLNPHAGEDGFLGGEEKSLIEPALAALRAKGHAVTGPLSADTLFHEEARQHYDAALTMYHDQGLIPIKTLSFWDGVNVTLGLPIVRTSPDHGTALDIAGAGKADIRSMVAAIRMAAEMADARAKIHVSDHLPPLRDVIAAYGLAAKKSLGQNFLLDLNLTRKIARAAGANDGGVFYEVGPGPGGLTRALLTEGASRVIAVERDARCLPALQQIAEAWPGKLEIIAADAMEIDETALLPQGAHVAANLPYNVGTALLVKWLTTPHWPPFWSSLTLMFQREVAQRITAKPGSEHYGRLSVLAGWRARAKIQFDVGPRAFVPPPSVISSIVRLEPLAEPVAPCALKDLEAVTAAAFGQRRKMLRQSLKVLGGEALPEKAGIDPTARPEELDVKQFAALARALRDQPR